MKLSSTALKRAVYALFDVVETRSNSDELTIVCPEPGCGDSSGNRSVNLKTGLTNCWRCNKGGNFQRWASNLGYEVETGDDDILYQDIDLSSIKYEKAGGRVIPYTNQIEFPKGFVPLRDEMESGYARLIAKMAKRKKLDLQAFADAGAGFTRDDALWEPYCIFPITEWEHLVYYQGRTYWDEPGESTKRFPSKKKYPLGSSNWLYNVDKIRQKQVRKIIVVEAILSVLSLERVIKDPTIVPVAVFKHKLSFVQVYKILQCKHIDEINLMFDSDATAASWQSCSGLINRFDVTVTEMPEDVDPNDDAEEAMRRFQKRSRYSTVSRLAFDIRNL
jgi:hypothetical protein